MTTTAAPPSPFKGLSPFADSDVDAMLFFGRVRETEVIAANLQASRLTVLYGPSGVGKSSVLRAGVAHRLRRERDVVVEVLETWSGDPRAALEEALRKRPADGDLYVILDQFEEYFVYHGDDDVLPRVLGDVIGERGLRVNILIGIREDALARLDAFRSPIPNLLANRLRLEPLDREAARTTIVGPVQRYNELTGDAVEVEPELVDAVLAEVAAGRVELGRAGRGTANGGVTTNRIEAPYLQLVLERLWEVERSEGSNRLRLDTLRGLGGAARIVHEHLERAMGSLTEDEQEAAARMYHHLVTPSGMKIAHGVDDLAGYASVDQSQAASVLAKLTRERIVRASSDDGPASTRYEIYHDVLADAVLAWRARHEEARALRHADERRRRAHAVAAAAILALIVVAAIAVFALVERSRARTQAGSAHAQQLAAEAITKLDSDPAASVRLALEAARLRPGGHEEEVLRNALTKDRERAVLRAGGRVTSAVFDSSGRRVLTAGTDGGARVYDRRGRLLASYRNRSPVAPAVFGPRRTVVTGGGDGMVRIWRSPAAPAATLHVGGHVRGVFVAGPQPRIVAVASNGTIAVWSARPPFTRVAVLRTHVRVLGAAVAPNARYVALIAHDRFVRVYDVAARRRVAKVGQKGYIGNVAFSHNGRLLLTSGNEGTVRLWRVGPWTLVRELRGPGSAVADATFSRDDHLVAGASNDGTVRVWDTATGFQRAVMIGHTNAVVSVAFNPDATAVVSTSTDGTARVWDVGGRPTSILAGHGAPVVAATFSPDGRAVVTAGDDGTARLWDPGSEPELRPVGVQRVIDLAVAADGKTLATAGSGLVVWSTTPLRRLRRLSSAETRLSAIAPDGTLAAATLAHRSVVIVGKTSGGSAHPRLVRAAPFTALAIDRAHRILAAAGRSVMILAGRGLRTVREVSVVHDLAVSPDGRLLATAGADGVVRLRDARTWALRRALRGHTDAVNSVDFNGDGTELVTTSRDHDVRIWDVATGRLERLLRWHFGPVADAAFSADGRWLVTAGPSTAGIGLAAGREAFRPGTYLRGPTRPLTAVGFGGSSGLVVFAAARDGLFRTFTCDFCGDVRQLMALARVRLARAG